MPYPDIKDSEHGATTGLLLGMAFYPEAIVAPLALIWVIFRYGLGINELWLSMTLTATAFAAIACFLGYFYADSIERAVARRKARFKRRP